MYNKVECILVTCDNCGETYENNHTGFSIFVDKSGASEDMWDCGWHTLDDKHYCPKCHTVNEEDELIINKEFMKSQVATGMPESTSLEGCPFNYCDSNPKCEGRCRYNKPNMALGN